jgi:hypothetical protein
MATIAFSRCYCKMLFFISPTGMQENSRSEQKQKQRNYDSSKAIC